MTNQKKLAIALALIVLAVGALIWGVTRTIGGSDNSTEYLSSDAVKLEVEQREHQRLVDMPAAEFDALYKDTTTILSQMKRANTPAEEIAVIQADLDKLEKAKADRSKKK